MGEFKMDERVQRLLPKKLIEIMENENFAFYLFITLILTPLVSVIINVLEIHEIILTNIQNGDINFLDFGFLLSLLTIIIGTVAIITITRYYLHIRSVDYLLIAYFIFGIVAWQIYLVYGAFVDPLFIIWGGPGLTALNSGIHSGFVMRHLTRQPYFWGMAVLFIQNVRMRSWKSYHPILKITIFIFFIDILLFVGIDFFTSTYIHEAATMETFLARVHETNAIVYNFTTAISQLFFPGTTSCLTISIMVYLFVIYTYITLRPENQTQSLKISRIIWIIYALFGLAVFLGGYLSMRGVYSIEWELIFQQILSLSTLVQLILLFIIQVFIPESLLITDYQILRARNMYKVIESDEKPILIDLNRVREYLKEVKGIKAATE
jgi:hypothetical protein